MSRSIARWRSMDFGSAPSTSTMRVPPDRPLVYSGPAAADPCSRQSGLRTASRLGPPKPSPPSHHDQRHACYASAAVYCGRR
ncbi:hypothetical protein N658DRAFT_494949 [Parathielavia hyrcaniae]|uniref:Uncharacterized protein n=1 Tax=Parathielavia hyrcaniae TaxID=113614 RepID=A0AAN6T3M5_9PEZI|nr:hypothetical protein N658DRAFT_494949 [Parathielavia hyrcaniae]